MTNTLNAPVEIEGEDRALDESLLDHIVERWHDSVHRDSGVSHAQDAVELCRHKGDPWLLSCLRERLARNLDVSNLRRVQIRCLNEILGAKLLLE